MFSSYLVKKKGMYHALRFLNLFAILLAPFVNTHLSVIDGGATSTDHEALLKEIEARVQKLIETSAKDNVKKSDVDKEVNSLNAMIKDLTDKQIKELKDTMDKLAKENEQLISASKAQGEFLAKMQNNSSEPAKKMTFREAIKQAIMEKKDIVLTEKNDDNGQRYSLKDYFIEQGQKNTPVFTVKAAVDMLQSNIVGNYAQYMRMAELDPKRVGIPLTVYPHVLDVYPQKGLNRPTMSLLVVYSYEDGSGTKAEGTASSKSSFLLKTVEFKSFNIATHFILSDETLDDLEEALDEISIVAPDKILDKIDSKVYSTTGDDSTDIKGLLVTTASTGKSTAFTASTYQATVVGANMIDVIAKMKLAVRKNKYKANYVGLNSTDIDNIGSLKDQLDNSISDRRLVFNANGELVKICGLTVVENDQIAANTCVVGDASQVMIGIRKAMSMEIGLNGTDFTEGQKTVRFTFRMAFGVRDQAAHMYSSDIASDLATITKLAS